MTSRAWDGVLALLVAASIGLSAALWRQQPQFREIAPDVTSSQTRRPPVGDPPVLTRPQLLLHFPDDRHTALSPWQPRYDYAWDGVVAALRGVRFERVADAPIPTAQEVRERRQDLAVEFTVSGTAPIDEWLATWGISRDAAEGDSPGVTRVLLSLQEPASAIVWTASGPRLLRTATSATLRDRLHTLSLAHSQTPWRQLPETVAGVRVSDGIYVPTVKSLPAFSVPAGGAGDPGDVAGAFFLDLSVVRTIAEHDEALLFTDGQAGLRVYPWGGVEYQRAQVQVTGHEPLSVAAALDRVYQYAAERDRWPREAYFAGTSRMSGQRTVRFGQRLSGWPVFASTPALEATLDGTTVVRYSRGAYPVVPLGTLIPIVPPEKAISAIAGDSGWRSVTAVELGYRRPSAAVEGAVYDPVWRITLTGGVQYLVDAVNADGPGGEVQ